MVALIDIIPEAHAELLFAWRQRPDIARFMYSPAPLRRTDHQRWIESLATDASRRHWVVEHAGRPVGSAYLTEIDNRQARAMFGMYVADETARMMGVGAAAEFLALDEAFGLRGLEKISCEVFAVNAAPLRMHARMGFRTEGVLRRHARCDGAWTDVHRLAILREEWQAVRPRLATDLRKLLGAPQAVPSSSL